MDIILKKSFFKILNLKGCRSNAKINVKRQIYLRKILLFRFILNLNYCIYLINKCLIMRKIFLLGVVFLITFSSYSQLYVSSNSYVFVKNQFVFVNQDVDLQSNGFLYLRNEGQLLQGTIANSTNKGFGKLSVFQEGTSDNFDYNYWCSPVGNASAVPGNENFGITMFHVPISLTNSNPATIYNYNYNGTSANGSLSIAAYWIWRYLSGTNYSEWIQSAALSNIAPGQGFTMKGTSGTDNTDVGESVVNNPGGAQRYDFRGKPNDGNISVIVGADKLTLTGNPYPSALHVNAFLLDPSNSDCTGIAYYWEQNKTVNSHYLLAYQGGYGTYAPISNSPTEYGVYVPATFNTYNIDGTLNTTGISSGLSIQRKYAPIGQGFMIKGKATGNPIGVTLKNSHRVFYKESGLYSEFERNCGDTLQTNNNNTSNSSAAVIRMNVIMNNQFTKQLALVLTPMATDGIDRGIDALSPVEETVPNDVYFVLDQDKYVIQGVLFDVDKRIPIGIKADNAATFTFDGSMVSNFDASQEIFIYDADHNSYHEIRNETFEISLAPGIYHNRFEITFKDHSLTAENSTDKPQFIIFQNNTTQFLEMSNPDAIGISSVAFYDLTGKTVFVKHELGSELFYQFPTQGLAEGVYLVELITESRQKITQKVIIKNK